MATSLVSSAAIIPRDILGHHVLTLLLALPLAVPLWSGCSALRNLDPTSLGVLDNLPMTHVVRTDFINAYASASSYAYASSLNKVFMCLQKVEMSLAGIASFRDLSTNMDMGQRPRPRFFTSKGMLCVDLCYKLAFFWGMSIVACKACCDFDRAVQKSIVSDSVHMHWITMLFAVYTCPAVLRGGLFRAFSLFMYPSMGLRSLRKIGRLHREGKEDKKKKIVMKCIVSIEK